MVVTYHIKIFRTGTDRHNDILSLLLLVAETIKPPSIQILKIKIIEENLEIFDNFLCINMNNFFKSSLFPSCKMANVTPLHKKGMKDLHENYWPVTILPILSKVFETSMFAQMFSFVLQLFCQNNNVPSGMAIVQRLLALLEKWNDPLIVVKYLVLHWQTFLRYLFASSTDACLQNLTHTDSAYQL